MARTASRPRGGTGPLKTLRTLWDCRHWVTAAFVLGVTIWFIVANRESVTVTFPFGMGQFQTLAGLAILMGFLSGSIVTGLLLTILWTIRRGWGVPSRGEPPYLPAPPPADPQPARQPQATLPGMIVVATASPGMAAPAGQAPATPGPTAADPGTPMPEARSVGNRRVVPAPHVAVGTLSRISGIFRQAR